MSIPWDWFVRGLPQLPPNEPPIQQPRALFTGFKWKTYRKPWFSIVLHGFYPPAPWSLLSIFPFRKSRDFARQVVRKKPSRRRFAGRGGCFLHLVMGWYGLKNEFHLKFRECKLHKKRGLRKHNGHLPASLMMAWETKMWFYHAKTLVLIQTIWAN